MGKWAALAIAGIWIGTGIVAFAIPDIDILWGPSIATIVIAARNATS